MTITITEWPEEERPREKLLARGAHALSDAELLAIFIRCGTKGKTAVDLAREVLKKVGNVKKLLDLNCKEFCQNMGLGTAKYAQLQATLEIGRRYLAYRVNGKDRDKINSVISAKLYCAAQLSQHQQEVFAVALLNGSNCVIHYAAMFHGTINRAVVYPREVVKLALQHNATAAVLMHNHVSGAVQPSVDDHAVTQKLQQALALVDVKMLDHIIVGNGGCFSFAEEKLI